MFNIYYWSHYGVKVSMKFINKLWWKLIPGVIVKVKWPSGEIIAGPALQCIVWPGSEDPRWRDWGDTAYVRFDSSDPNDHYRPWLEKNIGRQGWDWDWALTDDDMTKNQVTIRIRRKHRHYVPLLALKWS